MDTEEKQDELKACPFCMSDLLDPLPDGVLCTGCGATGPTSQTEAFGRLEWQRRASPPSATAGTRADEIVRDRLGADGDGLDAAQRAEKLCAFLDDALTRKPLSCYDCGFAYGGEGWCDVLVPDWAWSQVCPDEFSRGGGGILCFNCIGRRLARAKVEDVPLVVVSGPFATVDPSSTWIRQERGRPEHAVPASARFPSEEECREAFCRGRGILREDLGAFSADGVRAVRSLCLAAGRLPTPGLTAGQAMTLGKALAERAQRSSDKPEHLNAIAELTGSTYWFEHFQACAVVSSAGGERDAGLEEAARVCDRERADCETTAKEQRIYVSKEKAFRTETIGAVWAQAAQLIRLLKSSQPATGATEETVKNEESP